MASIIRCSWLIGSILSGAIALFSGCIETTAGFLAGDDLRYVMSCDPLECGHNDSWFNDNRFGQGRTDLLQTERGATWLGVVSADGSSYRLDVRDSTFVGLDWNTNDVVLQGEELYGGYIEVEVETEGELVNYRLHLDAPDEGVELPFDMTMMQREVIFFKMTFVKEGSQNAYFLCSGTNPRERIAIPVGDAHYDIETGVLDPPTDGSNMSDWFNIACGMHALQKSVLLGSDPQLTGAYATTALERQATVRMIRADYLGDGVSYTEAGTLLWWQNRSGWVVAGAPDPTSPTQVVEAYWRHDGAVCLNHARAPTILPDIDVLGIPTCDEFDPDTQSWDWVTYIDPS